MRINNACIAATFFIIWLTLSMVRPRVTDPYQALWYLLIFVSGALAATAGIFAYRWWNNH